MFGRHDEWLASLHYPSRSQDCPHHRRAIDELAVLVRLASAHTAIELGSGEPPSATAEMLMREGLAVTTLDLHSPADVQGDIHDLPLADDSFDLAVARHVLEHCPAPLLALREMRRIARWGLVVVPQDSHKFLWWGDHLSIFPVHVWERLIWLAGWQPVYFQVGDFSQQGGALDLEWRWLLRRADWQPQYEANGRNLGPIPIPMREGVWTE